MKTIRSLLTLLSAACLAASPAAVADGAVKSEEPVFWTFDVPGEVVGTSKLVRTKHGVTAEIATTGLTAGHAVTMWIVFFNNPEACAGPVCDPAVDGGNPAVGFDFHYGAGHIVNEKTTTLSGHLRAGETSTSGGAEVGGTAIPLLNPFGAQVWLAVHSHGPAQTGQILVDQMSSFLGGCDVLLGPGGFAASPADFPDVVGECTTFQLAFH